MFYGIYSALNSWTDLHQKVTVPLCAARYSSQLINDIQNETAICNGPVTSPHACDLSSDRPDDCSARVTLQSVQQSYRV
jgi:hypothetical protein